MQNPKKLINKGHTMAINVSNKYYKLKMTAFHSFTKSDIDSILIYIESEPVPHIIYSPEVRAIR